jgi:hypothetical protein
MCWLRAEVRAYWAAGVKAAAEAIRAETIASFMVLV